MHSQITNDFLTRLHQLWLSYFKTCVLFHVPFEIVLSSKTTTAMLALHWSWTLGSRGMMYLNMTAHIPPLSKTINTGIYRASDRLPMRPHVSSNDGQLEDHLLMSLQIDLPQATPIVKHKLWLTSSYRTMKNPVPSRHDVINRRYFRMYGFELLRRYVWRFCSVSAYILFINMTPHRRYFLSLAACNVHHAR